MLFGILFFDILLWFIMPVLLLMFLASDSQWWASAAIISMVAILGHTIGWSAIAAGMTDPVLIGNALQYILGYVVLGLIFSFMKWKVLATKAAASFREFIMPMNFRSIALDRFGQKRSEDTSHNAMEEPTLEELCAARASAASEWHRNSTGAFETHRLIAVRTAGNCNGWFTKYDKLRLAGYVTAWTIYWPFYALLLVLDDFIRHIFTWFVDHFGKMFQRMADASFSDIK